MLNKRGRYSLPAKQHDVVEDIVQLSATLRQIDSDVVELENKMEAFAQATENVRDSVIYAGVHLNDTVIHDIAPKRFVAIADDGTGITCADGDGAKGGTVAQCSIKRSNADFDITYADVTDISKNGTTLQTNADISEGGQFHIFCDEQEEPNEEQLPRKNVTFQQTVGDFELLPNEAVFLEETVEPLYKNCEFATKINYGTVKIGANIVCEEGTIAAKPQQTATKKRFGIVQIGDGITVEDGIITPASATPATHETAGAVKLGSDFEINENGAMEIGNMADAQIIYKLSQSKSVVNGNINLEEKTLIYKALVTADTVFTINTNFVATDDFTFVLEIISDGTHIVRFEDALKPISQTMPVNYGTTRMFFTRKLGYPYYEVEVSRADAPEPENLTPEGSPLISSNFLMSLPQGGNWKAKELLRTSYNGGYEAKEIRFDFETLVNVDHVNYISRNQDTPLTEFTLKGSVDGKTWTTLLHRENEIIYGKIPTEKKGCFRFYDLVMNWTSDNNKPGGVSLWGTQIDNNASEIKALTPQMSSNTTSYATFTASRIVSSSATQATDDNLSSSVVVGYDERKNRWAQYELATPATVNVLELDYYNYDAQANWFTLTGSNDAENWTLLLERQYLGNTLSNNGYRVMFYCFDNRNEYKYYRLNCLATNDTGENWHLCGFKLYQRNRGKHNFYGDAPVMSSAEQNGYSVLAGSTANSDNVAYYAFDGNENTKWTSVNNVNAERWLQLKFPSAVVCTTVVLQTTLGAPEYTPSDFNILGSNDGESFETLATFENIDWGAGQERALNFENQEAFLYYRIDVKQTQGKTGYAAIAALNFGYITYEYKRFLDKYTYVVPMLTGEVTKTDDGEYKVARSENSWGGSNVWYLFRRGNNTMEYYTMGEAWAQIELPRAKVVNAFSLKSRTDRYCADTARDYKLCGSNNGTSWATLFEIADSPIWGQNEFRTHNIGNKNAYKFYRLYFSNPGDREVCSVARWDLFEYQAVREY